MKVRNKATCLVVLRNLNVVSSRTSESAQAAAAAAPGVPEADGGEA